MDTQVTAIMTTITQIRIQYSVLCNLEYDIKKQGGLLLQGQRKALGVEAIHLRFVLGGTLNC